jgi:hypothetical protein
MNINTGIRAGGSVDSDGNGDSHLGSADRTRSSDVLDGERNKGDSGQAGSLGGVDENGSAQKSRCGRVGLCIRLAGRDGGGGHRADGSQSVDGLSGSGDSRDRMGRLGATTLARGHNESASGGVGEGLALLDSGNGAD